jgi:multidrug resistance efflux pump
VHCRHILLLYLRSYESTDDAQVDGHLNAGVVAAQAAADAAQKAIEQRRAQLAQVQARLNESKQNARRIVAIRQASTEARQAAVLTVRSQREQATLNLSYTKILRLPPAPSPANPWRLASEWSPASNC